MFLSKKKFNVTLDSQEMIVHKRDRKFIYWISQSGKRRLYSNLDNNHLKNIIAKIRTTSYEDKYLQLNELIREENYRTLIKNQQDENARIRRESRKSTGKKQNGF